eukprot:jgi/Mesvir1/5841/Mv26557-RA.1
MDAQNALDDDVSDELQALQAIWPDKCEVHHAPLRAILQLEPHAADDATQQFVKMAIEITIGPAYPEDALHVRILHARGLGDARQSRLLATLQEFAASAGGQQFLLPLAQRAHDELTSMNAPEGDCPFCLFPLAPSVAGSQGSDHATVDVQGTAGVATNTECAAPINLVKLPACFHCAHADPCFAQWWCWQQQRARESCCAWRRTSSVHSWPRCEPRQSNASPPQACMWMTLTRASFPGTSRPTPGLTGSSPCSAPCAVRRWSLRSWRTRAGGWGDLGHPAAPGHARRHREGQVVAGRETSHRYRDRVGM